MAHRFLRSPIWALLLFLPLPGWTNAQILNAELFQANEIQHEDQPVGCGYAVM